MKNKFYLIQLIIISLLIFEHPQAISKQSDSFEKGLKLFQDKEFEKSKILFERDIVFNPKSEKSYLYLAKIFNASENEEEEEISLNNVLLINPKNDEAIYMLTLLKIKQYDYDRARELIDTFSLVCESFCSKEKELQKKFKKLIPENEKDNN
tara:strand:+ start:2716 stop:3171 length:456 start_codon:yes stop_codon:yes gene_type:complete